MEINEIEQAGADSQKLQHQNESWL